MLMGKPSDGLACGSFGLLRGSVIVLHLNRIRPLRISQVTRRVTLRYNVVRVLWLMKFRWTSC